MFCYQASVHLKDTDATGVIFFSEQLKIAMEAFEHFLRGHTFSFAQILASPYLMPVVHAEADFMAPLRVDDELDVILYLEKIGVSSFSLSFDFFNKTLDCLAGTAKITHVLTLKETKRSTPLPEEFKDILLLLTPAKEHV